MKTRKVSLINKVVVAITFLAVLFTTSGLANVQPTYAEDSVTPTEGGEEYGTYYLIADEEVIAYRGEFEKHFANEDGTITAYSYAHPIHYLDADDNWRDIDNTLIRDEEGFANTNNPVEMRFAGTAKNRGLASVTFGEYKVSWGIQGTSNVVGYELEKQEQADRRDLTHLTSKVSYDNVFEGTSLTYTLNSYALSEDLMFHSVPTFDQVTYNIEAQNLIAVLEGQEVVFFSTLEEGEEVFRFQAPFMLDSAMNEGSLNQNIGVVLSTAEGGYTLTYVLDRGWLESAERVYPVTLDPTVKSTQNTYNISDTHTNSNNPNTNYQLSTYLHVGKTNGTSYSYVKIDTLPTLPSGSTITDAKLELYLASGTSTFGALQLWGCASAWSSSTLTWNIQGNIGYYLLQLQIYPSWSGVYYKYDIGVTSIVTNWYNNLSVNYGFRLDYQDPNYNDYNWITSSDNNSVSSTYWPAISVTYSMQSVIVIRMPNPTAQNKTKWCWAASAKMVGIHNTGSGGLPSGYSTLINTGGVLFSYFGVIDEYNGTGYDRKLTADAGQRLIVMNTHYNDTDVGGNANQIVHALELASNRKVTTGFVLSSGVNAPSAIVSLKTELATGRYVVGGTSSVPGGNAHAIAITQFAASMYKCYEPTYDCYDYIKDANILNGTIQYSNAPGVNYQLDCYFYCY